MSNTKQFHIYFKTPGQPLYWIIIAYIILAWLFPVAGLLALICMIGPVLTSIYDRLLAKYLPHKDNEDGLKYGDIENTWIIF